MKEIFELLTSKESIVILAEICIVALVLVLMSYLLVDILKGNDVEYDEESVYEDD